MGLFLKGRSIMLKSHPHQSLLTHLSGVWENTRYILKRQGILFWEDEYLQKLSDITNLCHDLGKSTNYFQGYMEKISRGEMIKGGPKERHSLLSAIIGYYLTKEYLGKKGLLEPTLPFFSYVAIKRHHGNLVDFLEEQNIINDADLQLLEKQITAIDIDKLNELMISLLNFFPREVHHCLTFDTNKLTNWVKKFNNEVTIFRRNVKRNRILNFKKKEFSLDKLSSYFNFCFLYSLLLESDKSQAAVGQLESEIRHIPHNMVDIFKDKQKWQLHGLNKMRQEAYEEIINNLKTSDQGSIFSITLPTGLGKTLAAYNFALNLREKRKKERNSIPPRIIYSLPFLSIIDQNLDVFEQIFKASEIDFDQTYILKHHHLSPTKYNRKANDEEIIYDPNASKILIEGWNSEIIVTTFIQLFESLISYRNNALRRFHKFANAIILVDEIQAIPAKYWDLVRYMFLYISKKMNTDIILITATQPDIFLPEDSVIELCNSQKYFSNLNRVEMLINLQKMEIEKFVENLVLKEDKSYLFILNTIGSAKKIYEFLTEKFQENIGFLSTQVIMKNRREIIKDIKNSKYRIVVSTQLVEAGVDIDFDVVYRDLAPLDSINQAAGRCNRNDLKKGEVHIIQLWNGTRTYASMIYDKVRLEITKEILKDKLKINESQFLQLINNYFREVRKKINLQESQLILNSVEDLCFNTDDITEMRTPISKFKLIEEQVQRENVFVEIDAEARRIWQTYEKILSIDGYFDRTKEFESIKNDFYDYVISVPVSYDLPPEINYFRYVSQNVLDTYYDLKLGFKDKTETMVW